MTPLTNFLDIASLSADQFWGLLRLAKRLKDERREQGQNEPILAGKTLGMVFQKPSLRTRVSFEMGVRHLGGHAIYIGPQEVGLGKRETAPDVARVLSGYVDGIMARVFAHEHVEQLAQWASVPVINGLSDTNHPCQALTDIFTIWESVGFVDEELAGLSVAFVGDGDNNIAYSLLAAAGKVGLSLRIVSPGWLPARPAPRRRHGRRRDRDGRVGRRGGRANFVYGRVDEHGAGRPNTRRASRR